VPERWNVKSVLIETTDGSAIGWTGPVKMLSWGWITEAAQFEGSKTGGAWNTFEKKTNSTRTVSQVIKKPTIIAIIARTCVIVSSVFIAFRSVINPSIAPPTQKTGINARMAATID
jgi:hypothetical protein